MNPLDILRPAASRASRSFPRRLLGLLIVPLLPLAVAAGCGEAAPGPSPGPRTTTTPVTTPTTTPAVARAVDTLDFDESYGFCVGYCTQQIRLGRDGSCEIRHIAPREDQSVVEPCSPGTAELEAIFSLADGLAGDAWEERYGCPDCADQGAYTLALSKDASILRQSVLDPGEHPASFDPLIEKVRALMARYPAPTEPPHTVTAATYTASYGECAGYCKTSVRVEVGGACQLTQSTWDGSQPDNVVDCTEALAATPDLFAQAETLRSQTWEARYGCPDCADQGAYALSLEGSGGEVLRETVLDPGDHPATFDALLDDFAYIVEHAFPQY